MATYEFTDEIPDQFSPRVLYAALMQISEQIEVSFQEAGEEVVATAAGRQTRQIPRRLTVKTPDTITRAQILGVLQNVQVVESDRAAIQRERAKHYFNTLMLDPRFQALVNKVQSL